MLNDTAIPADNSLANITTMDDGNKYISSYVIKNHGLDVFQKIHATAIIVLPFIGFIVACALIPVYGFSNLTFILFLVFYFMTMVLGITVGFHRMLAHRSFTTSNSIRALLTVFGCMAAQGSPVYWVSNHRRHHQFSDKPLDPHSPHYNQEKNLTHWQGFFHSHFGWMFNHDLTNSARYAKDILKDKTVMSVGRHYFFWVALGILLPPAIAGAIEGTLSAAIMAFLWGSMARLFLSFHATSSVNSICHLTGHQRYKTMDGSRNNAWLSIITGGESWHNNHHAFPYSARFGLRWYQLDIGYLSIVLMESIGLVSNVKRVK
ncbi:acyl-CoA desaturase [Cellvibrio mixtus]|uniref:acyl-CoA desaturase n=1 Tax=Cellvibrio mixtus TaxID=39650 RepID=UPI00069374DE|nr:acyl-CoA desaturase [Cellvibrio mixtus]